MIGLHKLSPKNVTQELLDEEKSYSSDLAKELCEITDALGCPCETERNHEKAMERIRDLIAAEGKLADCEELLKTCWGELPDSMGNYRIRKELVRLEII